MRFYVYFISEDIFILSIAILIVLASKWAEGNVNNSQYPVCIVGIQESVHHTLSHSPLPLHPPAHPAGSRRDGLLHSHALPHYHVIINASFR